MYTILHVDNSIFLKTILHEAADENKFKLITVPDPNTAIEVLKNERFDLIITGLEFKGMTGLDFIKYLNTSVHRDTNKVILTSNDSVELRKKAEALGVMDVLQKDISLNSLYMFIERIKNMDIVKSILANLRVAVVEVNNKTIEVMNDILISEGVKNIEYYHELDDIDLYQTNFELYIIKTTHLGTKAERFIIDAKKHNMNAIIIAISDIYHSENLSDIMLAGSDDFIIEPLNRKLFMARINAHVRLKIHLDDIQQKNLQLEQVNQVLNRMVITDGLTGLFNRTFTMESLEINIDNAMRYKHDLSIIMLDIDHFKHVNDNYGHQVGDLVLTELSKLIQTNTRKSDIVGRYGGEEFLIVLPETNIQNGIIISEKIRVLIENHTFEIEGLKVTISCGLYTRKNEGITELVKKADELLYEAKNTGRNQTAYEKNK